MTAQFDLVIRGGTVVDGTGAEPRRADVAIRDGLFVEVGEVAGQGREEIDAEGLLVTPGFVDLHTHYDGQAIWSNRLNPSSSHGVTTVVIGNCGVGFAPCRPADRDLLVTTMEGVEDIPGIVMAAGLTWEWETFPQFLDAIEARAHDIDIAAFAPHSPIRVYAMGERGANRETATEADLARMYDLVREAVEAGAVGVATTRTLIDRRADGELVPSFNASERELVTLAQAVRDGGGGIVQMLTELGMTEDPPTHDFQLLRTVATQSGQRVTFTHNTGPAPEQVEFYNTIYRYVCDYNGKGEGPRLHPQFPPRAIGMLASFDLTSNPWVDCPTYKGLAHLPLAERVRELRKPDIRRRILDETPAEALIPLNALTRQFDLMFELAEPPCYEPRPEDSVSGRAAATGKRADEMAYDLLLQDEGRTALMVAVGNYLDGFDHLLPLFDDPNAVIGLGDGGAHCGLICDSSYPTFMLTHWSRDREGAKVPLAKTVRAMTATPAAVIGFDDRGIIAPGMKADVNVIDFAALTLHRPYIVNDLPGGGRRLDQKATGYRYTIVSGEVIARDDEPTGALPGRLVRGPGHRKAALMAGEQRSLA